MWDRAIGEEDAGAAGIERDEVWSCLGGGTRTSLFALPISRNMEMKNRRLGLRLSQPLFYVRKEAAFETSNKRLLPTFAHGPPF